MAVGSLFIAPGMLPDRVRSQALESDAIVVSEPLGANPQLCTLILDRYLAHIHIHIHIHIHGRCSRLSQLSGHADDVADDDDGGCANGAPDDQGPQGVERAECQPFGR